MVAPSLRERLAEMAERRDPDVTLSMGRVHALVALFPPSADEALARVDVDALISDARFAALRREAIRYARHMVERSAPGTLRESSARYALRLLGADAAQPPIYAIDGAACPAQPCPLRHTHDHQDCRA